jgi:HAD superfamily hydrolase (TIGR01509 family)
VEQVLAELHSRGLKIGLVTDSPATSLDPLQSEEIIQYFSAMVTIDDGIPKKPEPDGLIECLCRMDTRAENAVFVGDALIDIRAGKKAGTLTIGVLTGLANRRQFESECPTALVEDVTQVPTVLNLI